MSKTEITDAVLYEVAMEREKQDARWGEQNHPSRHNSYHQDILDDYLDYIRYINNEAAEDGSITWDLILKEEVAEACAESDPGKLRQELIQVAAVACAWIECLDRKATEKEQEDQICFEFPPSGAV